MCRRPAGSRLYSPRPGDAHAFGSLALARPPVPALQGPPVPVIPPHLNGASLVTATTNTSRDAPPAADLDLLTPRQHDVVHQCLLRGYYAIPRRTTLRTLAKDLGISTTSLSLLLRRAEARLVQHHFHDLMRSRTSEDKVDLRTR